MAQHGLDEGFFHAGLAVWVANPHPEGEDGYRAGRLVDPKRSGRPVFVPAKVVEGLGNGKARVETSWEPKVVLECATTELFPANVADDVDDMVQLAHLNDATLLQNVQTRYHCEAQQQIYTMAGPILIAVNPYRIVRDRNGTSIYDASYIERYQAAVVRGERAAAKDLGPHVFGVAANAVATFLEEGGQDQSIVISGESGAGKTESTKQIMQFITSCSASAGKRGDVSIEDKLLRSNPVLEALGNAKTLRNDNSSRFGKFIQIMLDRSSGQRDVGIKGGRIKHFLLEKSRVVFHLPGERNFHIFYQLLAGCNADSRAAMRLAAPESYRYLNADRQRAHAESLLSPQEARRRGGSIAEDAGGAGGAARPIDDREGFAQLEESLAVVGFDADKKRALFQIVAGVLHLGNIELEATAGGEGCQVVDGSANTALQAAAEMLGLDAGVLATNLAHRETSTSGQVIRSPLDKERAYSGIDALAKSVYGRLFQWVVLETNRMLAGADDAAEGAQGERYIGILDIFGFEVFKKNGFEQFCINFANEKLHQLFTTYVFKMEQKLYEQEGIDYSDIRFTDNQYIIDLVEKKPVGIFSLLDEACLFPKSTDDTFLSKLDSTHARAGAGSRAPLYRKGTLKETKYGPAFVISHSAAPVVYTVAEFLQKNRDRLEANVSVLLEKSSTALVAELFAAGSGGGGGGGGGNFTGANAFLGSKFKEDIGKLMQTLHATTPHFVRCLKANAEKRPGYMSPDVVLHQLQYLGVLDSVRIRHSGFSFRTTFERFYSRFAMVVPSLPSPARLQAQAGYSDDMVKQRCQELVKHLWRMVQEAQEDHERRKLSSACKGTNEAITTLGAMIQMGRTMIFLRKQMIQALEALRDVKLQALDAASLRLQSVVRMFLTRRALRTVREGLERIRAAWRGARDREAWSRHWRALQSARAAGQVWSAKAKLGKQRRAVHTCQAFARGVLARGQADRARAAATLVQSFARCTLQRSRLVRMRQAAGATALQRIFRGAACRRRMPRIMHYLAEKRAQRAWRRAARTVQRQWQAFLVRRRFLRLVSTVKALQLWASGFVLRAEFLSKRQNVRTLQRVARGFLARSLRRRMITQRLLEEQNWRINQARYREGSHVVAVTSGKYCGDHSSDRYEMAADMERTPVKGHHAVHCVVDVDVIGDVSRAYPSMPWVQSATQLQPLEMLESGLSHSVALTQEGRIYTWGFSDRGQLGHGKFAPEDRPRRISLPLSLTKVRVVQIAVGEDHSLALTRQGKVFSWGAGQHGQLGHGRLQNEAEPRLVETMRRRPVDKIACTATASFAGVPTGLLYAWGGPGPAIGHGVYVGTGDQSLPHAIKQLAKERVAHLAAGIDFVAVATKTGAVFTWGTNSHNQLGHDTRPHALVPKRVRLPTAEACVKVACGGRHCAAVTACGSLYAWGDNAHGQLGLGHTKVMRGPHRVLLPSAVHDVALGWRHSVALCKGDRVYCWGLSSLATPQDARAPESLLSSDEDESRAELRPKRVPFNMVSAGRVPTRLHASKFNTLSHTSLVYTQKPATVAMVTAPLLGGVSLGDKLQTSSIFPPAPAPWDESLAGPSGEAEADADQGEVLVDMFGKQKQLDELSPAQLKGIVRRLIKAPDTVRASLRGSPVRRAPPAPVLSAHQTTFRHVPSPAQRSSAAVREEIKLSRAEKAAMRSAGALAKASEERARRERRALREGKLKTAMGLFASSLLAEGPRGTASGVMDQAPLSQPFAARAPPAVKPRPRPRVQSREASKEPKTTLRGALAQERKPQERKPQERKPQERKPQERKSSRASRGSVEEQKGQEPGEYDLDGLVTKLRSEATADVDAIWRRRAIHK